MQFTKMFSRAGGAWVSLWTAWALSTAPTGAAAATAPLTKGPYLQAPGATTMTIMWETLQPVSVRVFYGPGDQLDQSLQPPPPKRMESKSSGRRKQTFYVYEAVLRHLKPSTRYAYQLEVGGRRLPVRHFKTFGQAPAKVRFVVYGDTRTRPEVHAALAKLIKPFHPDFILHTGDLVARGEDYALWSREFFDPLADVIDEVPLLPALGNHEQNGVNFLAYFHLPGKERWYSFEVGPVHVLVLDYHYPQADHPQFAFAKHDLEQTRAPWKIVMLHYPMFNIGGHRTSWGHRAYLPLFHQEHVDLVVTGHSHIYERFRPLVPEGQPHAWAITHITSGGGGAPLYPAFQHPALAAVSSMNHFIVMDASAERLEGRVITRTGATFDRFTLQKTDDTQPAAYLAEAYPEEWIERGQQMARGLTGRLAGLPADGQPADVLLTLVPPSKQAGRLEVQIELTADSASQYELVGAPVKVVLDAGRVRAHQVWVQVKPRPGVRMTAEPHKAVSPELIFRARIKAGKMETVAIGESSRLSATAARLRRQMRSGG